MSLGKDFQHYVLYFMQIYDWRRGGGRALMTVVNEKCSLLICSKADRFDF